LNDGSTGGANADPGYVPDPKKGRSPIEYEVRGPICPIGNWSIWTVFNRE
jgi:hypothetical protein